MSSGTQQEAGFTPRYNDVLETESLRSQSERLLGVSSL